MASTSEPSRPPPPLPPRPGAPTLHDLPPSHVSFQTEQAMRSSDTLNSIASEVPDIEEDVELTDEQLRELYDCEEIDRFLRLFSAYVTEVRIPDTPAVDRFMRLEKPSSQDVDDNIDEGDWIPLNGPVEIGPAPKEPVPLFGPLNLSFSERVAQRYLVPILPPAPMEPPTFTVGRLRLTTQRLYLAVEPAYMPFFSKLAKLALWKDRFQSRKYCLIFWMLWYHSLLLPALFLWIFYALVRRKLFPYPTVAELRERRREVGRADEFGQEIQARLSASSSFGVKEAWRLFKVINKPRGKAAKGKAKQATSKSEKKAKKAKEKAKGKQGDEVAEGEDGENDAGESPPPPLKVTLNVDDGDNLTTVLDDPKDEDADVDWKQVAINVMSELADLHERMKNMFIWRRPASSKIYGSVIFLLFLVTLFVPAKYIAKMAYAIGGFFFWHITPLIAAMSPADRARLPPAFGDLPTDADYAMDLISQRVADGLPVRPAKIAKKRRHRNKANTASGSTSNLDGLSESSRSLFVPPGRTGSDVSSMLGDECDDGDDTDSTKSRRRKDMNVNWKKWGNKAALSKKFILGVTGGQPAIDGIMQAVENRQAVETHTFPAQHSAVPGLITLTPTHLYFTPILKADANVIVPLAALRGVKKSGMFKGLSIRWSERKDTGGVVNGSGISNDSAGGKLEMAERFLWIGGREELFARLIGAEGKRWMKA